MTIDIASVNSESKDRDDTIRAAGLFDVATWPTARFEADALHPERGTALRGAAAR